MKKKRTKIMSFFFLNFYTTIIVEFFDKNILLNYRSVITSWSSGTGAAGILGALTYAGLTGVFHLSPSMTMYLMLSVPFLMAVS